MTNLSLLDQPLPASLVRQIHQMEACTTRDFSGVTHFEAGDDRCKHAGDGIQFFPTEVTALEYVGFHNLYGFRELFSCQNRCQYAVNKGFFLLSIGLGVFFGHLDKRLNNPKLWLSHFGTGFGREKIIDLLI